MLIFIVGIKFSGFIIRDIDGYVFCYVFEWIRMILDCGKVWLELGYRIVLLFIDRFEVCRLLNGL